MYHCCQLPCPLLLETVNDVFIQGDLSCYFRIMLDANDDTLQLINIYIYIYSQELFDNVFSISAWSFPIRGGGGGCVYQGVLDLRLF